VQAMVDSIHRNVYSHHPLGAKTTASVAAAADYGTILDLYRDRFADVSDFTFYVAGDFDVDSLKTCLESYVASLPAAGRIEKVRDIGYRFTPGSQNMCFYADMQTPQAIVYTFYHGPSKYDVSTAVVATALGRIVKSRLLVDLRESRGWVYSVTGHCSALSSMNDCDPSSFLFPIYIKTSPEHAEETAAVVSSTLGDVAEKGVTEEELGKVREYLLKSSADNGDDNAYWLSVFKVFNDNGIDMNAEFAKAVEAILPSDVSDFARDTVLKGDCTRLMMLPKK
ncbi:MAG: insulinase family protein, partial [Muribaculaceae bacterium]|nr:insulinase family protein [Muribaculaceae bacterium]